MRRLAFLAATLLIAAGPGGAGPEGAGLGEAPVENFRDVAAGLCVGGEPAGDAAFAALAARGVTTVVSVDGAKPDVAAAKRHGLRYVHVPFGYDGVPDAAALALVRVVREADGPVFVHCHHGKHRGPTAAAVAGIATGKLDHAAAKRLLERSGTSPDYGGLWRDVAAFTPPPAAVELPPLVETAEVGSLAAAMAELDRTFDRLTATKAAEWNPPADQPDLVPHREAALLRESFRESARLLPDDRKDLRPGLTDSESLAVGLTEALRTGDRAAATAKLTALKASCTACHRRHRDGG